MPNPDIPDIYPHDLGTEMYEALAPLVDAYGDEGKHLWIYVHALSWMLKQVDDISKDGPNDEPGWSQIFDLTRAKTGWLPWMGQLVGYYVPPRSANQSLADYDAEQRERIITRSAHRRGTTQQMVDVVQEHLVPPKRVIVSERWGGDPYTFKIWVHGSEIASWSTPTLIMQAINRQKAAGLLLEFGVLDEESYDDLRANSASYLIAKNKFADYEDLSLHPDRP
jgi:hypothetical protein